MPTRAEAQRSVAIDVLKAIAIVTVVWIHAFLPGQRPRVGWFLILNSLTRFAVPAFFFAAGFLHFRVRAIDLSTVGRRLKRIGIPYLFASAAVLVGLTVYQEPPSWSDALLWIVIGNSLGIYYFIPPYIGAVLLGVLLSRVQMLQLPLFIVLFVFGLISELGWMHIPMPNEEPFLWTLRNPLRWWGYYVAGWLLARHRHRIGSLGKRTRSWLGVICAVLVVFLMAIALSRFSPARSFGWVLTEYLRIYGCILAIVLLAWDRYESRAVRWLSEATYPIYLYHYCFIVAYSVLYLTPGQMALLGTPARDRFVIGLFGSLLLVALARRLFGEGAGTIIGFGANARGRRR